MKEFSTSGTLGDTFLNVVKLYKLAQEEDIHVYHYTIHNNWVSKIARIYQLLPRVSISFVPERDLKHPRIHSHFSEKDEYELEIEPFPEFDFEDTSIPDEDYYCFQKHAGKKGEERDLPGTLFHEWVKDDAITMPICPERKLSLSQVFNEIKYCKGIIAPQGLMCFVAMSQKVPTVAYCSNEQYKKGLEVRTLLEWEEYLEVRSG